MDRVLQAYLIRVVGDRSFHELAPGEVRKLAKFAHWLAGGDISVYSSFAAQMATYCAAPEYRRKLMRFALPVIRRARGRESHRGRAGHRRGAMRSSALSGDSPDDPPGSSPPRLRLAPKPGAIYSYGVRAREQWGLE